jgi:spore coat polysaccharide biosynthesis predicted glycosyltransferase SpsG
VLAGASNPHAAELAAIAAHHPGRFEVLPASDRMPEEMAEADLAISAGGSTCWELAFMGLPAVVITLAPNQEHIGPSLAARGVCIDGGWHHSLKEDVLAATVAQLVRDPERRRIMSEKGRVLVDGGGAERVVEALKA